MIGRRKKETPDQILGHADEADGIEEYDNPLPDWWVGLFLFTILWGVGYAVDYHFISDRSQAGAYEKEMAAAAIRWPEREAVFETTPETLAAGKEIYDANCVGCHAADLTGGIGPDLTDGVWEHGGSFEEVSDLITRGVPEKGMLAWGPILGPQRIGEVTAYILSVTEEASAAAEE